MPRHVRVPTSRATTRRPRAKAATHAGAGFVIGLLAMVTGFGMAGTGLESSPVSEAADLAAARAAVRMTFEPGVRPSAAEPVIAPAQPLAFLTEGEEPLIRPAGPTRIVIESVGIDALVSTVGYVFRDGALEYDVPRREAGHYVDTALPGDRGNVVIGGHVANRTGKAVFAPLPDVKAGDLVQVYRGDQVFRYSITEIKVVAVEATSVMSQTQDARLTLITCFPERNYPHRLVVVGKLV